MDDGEPEPFTMRADEADGSEDDAGAEADVWATASDEPTNVWSRDDSASAADVWTTEEMGGDTWLAATASPPAPAAPAAAHGMDHVAHVDPEPDTFTFELSGDDPPTPVAALVDEDFEPAIVPTAPTPLESSGDEADEIWSFDVAETEDEDRPRAETATPRRDTGWIDGEDAREVWTIPGSEAAAPPPAAPATEPVTMDTGDSQAEEPGTFVMDIDDDVAVGIPSADPGHQPTAPPSEPPQPAVPSSSILDALSAVEAAGPVTDDGPEEFVAPALAPDEPLPVEATPPAAAPSSHTTPAASPAADADQPAEDLEHLDALDVLDAFDPPTASAAPVADEPAVAAPTEASPAAADEETSPPALEPGSVSFSAPGGKRRRRRR